MSSERARFARPFLAAAAALLAGCLLGPWNLTPQDGQAKVRLEVACMLVAGRPFDTLWLERPLAFATGYDSADAFVDTSATRIFVVRADVSPAETVFYRRSTSYSRAWLPDGNARDTVRMGGRYRLTAAVTWDAAREYPRESEVRVDTLEAETYVQRRYAVRDTALVPIEALHPSLSLGLPPAVAAKALGDAAALNSLYDSLEAIRSLSALGATRADFLRYLQGYLVLKPLASGDSAWYIFDPSKVADPDPRDPDPIGRYSRQWYFLQDFDARDFGGLASVYAYDTSGSRILDPIFQALRNNFGRDRIDSAGQYQIGHTRFLGVTAASDPANPGYPDTVAWSNRNLGYAGRDAIYFYAVDSLYAEYQRGFPGVNVSLGGGNGGGGNGSNLVRYSNVRNGDGYFAAAALDSFVVHLSALKDTLSIPALHRAWLEREARRKAGGR
jgi:hypothetical protein